MDRFTIFQIIVGLIVMIFGFSISERKDSHVGGSSYWTIQNYKFIEPPKPKKQFHKNSHVEIQSVEYKQYQDKVKAFTSEKPRLDIDTHFFDKRDTLLPHNNFIMDAQGWYSIMAIGATKAMIHKFEKQMSNAPRIYDFFAGCGGSAYHLAEAFPRKPVICVELDTIRSSMLKHNLKSLKNVEVIQGSAFDHTHEIENSVTYMSPPWEYLDNNIKKSARLLSQMKLGDKTCLDWKNQLLAGRPQLVIMHLDRYANTTHPEFAPPANYKMEWFMIQRPPNSNGHPTDSLLLTYELHTNN